MDLDREYYKGRETIVQTIVAMASVRNPEYPGVKRVGSYDVYKAYTNNPLEYALTFDDEVMGPWDFGAQRMQAVCNTLKRIAGRTLVEYRNDYNRGNYLKVKPENVAETLAQLDAQKDAIAKDVAWIAEREALYLENKDIWDEADRKYGEEIRKGRMDNTPYDEARLAIRQRRAARSLAPPVTTTPPSSSNSAAVFAPGGPRPGAPG